MPYAPITREQAEELQMELFAVLDRHVLNGGYSPAQGLQELLRVAQGEAQYLCDTILPGEHHPAHVAWAATTKARLDAVPDLTG